MSKELPDAIGEFRGIMIALGKVIQARVEEMRPAIETIALAVEEFRAKYAPLFKQFAETIGSAIVEIAKRAKAWQEEQKISVSFMAEHGWFPNWFTFFFHPEKKYSTLDDFMIAHMDENWNEIKKRYLNYVQTEEVY